MRGSRCHYHVDVDFIDHFDGSRDTSVWLARWLFPELITRHDRLLSAAAAAGDNLQHNTGAWK